MEDTLIRQIQLLKQIKPRKDWVILTKNRILAQATEEIPVWQGLLQKSNVLNLLIWGERLALGRAGIATFAIALFMGVFGFAQNSVPGDTLYPVKKAILQGEAVLLSEGQATLHLRVAADSSQALKEAAKVNDSQKLAIALQEYRDNISKAAGILDKEPKDAKKILKIASLVTQIQSDAKEIESILQTEVAKEERQTLAQKTLEEATNELEGLLARELQDIASRSLTEEQSRLLNEAQVAFDKGDYAKVMELIVRIGGR